MKITLTSLEVTKDKGVMLIQRGEGMSEHADEITEILNSVEKAEERNWGWARLHRDAKHCGQGTRDARCGVGDVGPAFARAAFTRFRRARG